MQNTCALANESPREFELTKRNFISHFSIGSKSAHDEFLGIPRNSQNSGNSFRKGDSGIFILSFDLSLGGTVWYHL